MSAQPTFHARSGGLARLPPELRHLILKYIDKNTLSACSLAARDWLHIARPYLFRVIRYQRRPLGASDPPSSRIPLLQDLLEFLDATPSVRKFIRVLSLKIIFTNRLDTAVAFGEANQGKGAQLTTLRSILRHTSHLRYLDVSNFRFARHSLTPDSTTLNDGAVLDHLHHLRVDPPQFDCDNTLLAQLMTLVGTIGTLIFNTVIPLRRTAPLTQPLPSPLPPPTAAAKRVSELHINNTHAIRPPSAIDIAHLESFYIEKLQWEDFPWFSDFLRNAGTASGLLHLGLPVHSCSPWPQFGLGPDQDCCLLLLNLSVFERLQTLTLSLPAWTPTPRVIHPDDPLGVYASGYDFIVRILSITSDTLHSITFRLTSSALPWMFDRGGTHNMRTDWSKLDSALADRALTKGLKIVQFILSSFVDNTIAREAVKRSLPRTFAAGVLQLASA